MKKRKKKGGAENVPQLFSPEQGNKEFELTQVAYHEAGHVAAYAFFDHEDFFDSPFDHIIQVSIVPNNRENCVGSVQVPGDYCIDDLPPKVELITARIHAICYLAGPIAEEKYRCSIVEDDSEDKLKDFVDSLVIDLETGESRFGKPDGSWYDRPHPPGSDLYRVNSCAKKVTRKDLPVNSLFWEWAILTLELLDRPDVWQCVCEFAEHLKKVREVAGQDLEPHFKEIRGASGKSKRWRKQIRLKTVDVLKSWY